MYAFTGKTGDGKKYMLDVKESVQIRLNEVEVWYVIHTTSHPIKNFPAGYYSALVLWYAGDSPRQPSMISIQVII